MAPLQRCLLLVCVVLATVFGSGSSNESCSFELNVNSSPSADVIIQQHISNDEDVTVSLTVEGKSWVAVGFNRDGQMVGSTVVIGLPGQPREVDINPGRYFLGAKDVKQINRVDASGNRVGVEWKTQQAVALTKDNDNDDNGGDEDGEEWRRSLYLPQEHHRLLTISNAILVQNLTHTTLSFTRPLASSDKYMTAVTENDLNTLIWAVGSSNDFGYHGSLRGSHTLNFTACPHGLLHPTPSYDSLEGEVEAHNENDEGKLEEEKVEINPQSVTLGNNLQTSAASKVSPYTSNILINAMSSLLLGILASCLVMTLFAGFYECRK
ncbi:hypothetical protein ACHAWT_010051 [Skeletonema menzelii]